MDFQPYRQRVIEERIELEGRLNKLAAFTFSNTYAALPEAERSRLLRQYNLMVELSGVLEERIKAFTADAETVGA